MNVPKGGGLWITKMVSRVTDKELVTIYYSKPGGARGVFDHAKRVLRAFPSPGVKDDLNKGDLIVTLLDSNGDLVDDDPIRVRSERADWFIYTWLNLDKYYYSEDTGGRA